MKVLVASDNRIYLINGNYFASNSFQKVILRYKRYFGAVVICTRVICTNLDNDIPDSYVNISDITTEIFNIKSLLGVFFGKRDAFLRRVIIDSDLVVARLPTVTGMRVSKLAKKLKKKYLAEVVGCAWDAYWNHGLAGKLFAPFGYSIMKNTVRRASYVTYVTSQFLQKRYPCSCHSINCSNVLIDSVDQAILENRYKKNQTIRKTKITLFTAAAIDVAYKGQRFVIEAIPYLRKKGYGVEYRMAGTGSRDSLNKVAARVGATNDIVFLGAISRENVIKELDNADIYIQPSLQEGLPRSVIEAMSRGCLVLGANTAGIPELIDKECVFKKASPRAIANSIIELIDCEKYDHYSTANFEKSKDYESSVLEARRKDYYDWIKEDMAKSPLLKKRR